MNMVAEGVKTAHTVMELAARHEVDLPICAEIRRVVSGEISAVEAYRGLMAAGPGRPRVRPGLIGRSKSRNWAGRRPAQPASASAPSGRPST